MIIFTKQKEKNKYQVRTLGHTYWIDKDELLSYVQSGQLAFKANYPVTEKNVVAYL